MKPIAVLTAVLFTTACLILPTSFAETLLEKDASPPLSAVSDQFGIEPVIVSAVRSPKSGITGAGAVTVVTRAEIEASGASNVAEVLRGRAGAQITDLYGDGSRVIVSMRGFGENAASNTLMLVDGRRLNNPDLAAPEIAAVSLKDVERIEIVEGSAGTLFGDQAVGGVINIITRTPDRLRADASAAAGSYDSRGYSAHVANALDNGISFRVSAEDRTADNYRRHNEIDYRNVLGRLDFTHERGVVFFDTQTIDEQANLPGGLFRAEYDADRRQPRFPTDFADTRTDANRLGLRQELTPAWWLEAELARRDSDITGVLSATAFTQNRRVEELTPRLVGTRHTTLGDAVFTLGVDQLSARYGISSMFGTTDAEQRVRGVYAQAVVPASEHTTVTLGARRARVENDLRDSFAFPTAIQLDDSANTVEVGVSWRFDSWRFFARRDGNFRFAKIDEQTATFGGVVGLKTQTGRSYEAGTEWAHGDNAFKMEIYRLDLDNEIDFDTTTFANVNLDPTRRDGLLLEASRRVNERLALNGQYGHVDARFRSGPFQDKTVPFVADQSLRLTLEYRPNSAWQLFGELQTISDRMASGDISNALDILPGYSVVNAKAQYRVKSWTTSLRINNLANRKYADYAASSFNPATFANETAFYAAPERNLRLQVQYDLR
jgi:iron complex outermembrane receptor protein